MIETVDFVRQNHLFSVTFKGWSMYPTLKKGDRVEVSEVGLEVAVGDLVFFRDGPLLVCHRVLRVLPDRRLFVRGDSFVSARHLIRHEMVLGKVVKIIRGKKNLDPRARRKSPSWLIHWLIYWEQFHDRVSNVRRRVVVLFRKAML